MTDQDTKRLDALILLLARRNLSIGLTPLGIEIRTIGLGDLHARAASLRDALDLLDQPDSASPDD